MLNKASQTKKRKGEFSQLPLPPAQLSDMANKKKHFQTLLLLKGGGKNESPPPFNN